MTPYHAYLSPSRHALLFCLQNESSAFSRRYGQEVGPRPFAQWGELIGARRARSVWSSGLASRRMRRAIGKVAITFVLLTIRDGGGAETRVARETGLLERYGRG